MITSKKKKKIEKTVTSIWTKLSLCYRNLIRPNRIVQRGELQLLFKAKLLFKENKKIKSDIALFRFDIAALHCGGEKRIVGVCTGACVHICEATSSVREGQLDAAFASALC